MVGPVALVLVLVKAVASVLVLVEGVAGTGVVVVPTAGSVRVAVLIGIAAVSVSAVLVALLVNAGVLHLLAVARHVEGIRSKIQRDQIWTTSPMFLLFIIPPVRNFGTLVLSNVGFLLRAASHFSSS